MKMKIILLTVISGTAALLIAQQTQYQGTAPGNPNAPAFPPNNVIRTQSVSPQEISPQNVSTQQVSPQGFSTNQLNNSQTNWNSRHRRPKEDLNIRQPLKQGYTHAMASAE